MSPTLIAAGAATAGSFVGALGSVVGTWITQRRQDGRDVLAKKVIHREALYSDFIGESARLLVDSLEYNITDAQKLIPIYALLSRIRLSSSQHVLETAEKIMKLILTRYQQPNLTLEQIRSRAVNGDDPLREFGDVCRIELDSMQKRL